MLFGFSLRTRIYISMLMMIMVSFIVIGVVTVRHFMTENEEYHQNRLERKETAVIKSIGYFLEREGIYDNPDSVVVLFSDKITELADINNLDINIFNLKGELLISSHSDYFEKGVFVFQLDEAILKDLSLGNNRLIQEVEGDTLSILSTYRYMNNIDNRPIAIINLPYFQENKISRQEIRDFLVTLSEVYLFLFMGAAVVAYFLSNYITGSIQTIGAKLKQISIGKRNEPLDWKSNDEIGALVKEYNRMLFELEKSAQLLAQSERESAWREMAKQVAHEIKNPLTPMKLSVQHLERTLSSDSEDWEERLQKFSNAIIEQIDTLSDIASEFSNFAKMPQAKMEKVDVNKELLWVLELFKDLPNVSVSYSNASNEFLEIKSDRNQISRAFTNLIKNAIQAIPKERKGEINIDARKNKGKVLVSIQDNGTGISEDKKTKIFTPNFTTKTSGMGLGLAMVKNIVENSNGQIWFETEVEKGTTFYISFPVA
ncbi:MAG: GHKL domain-containing protein [Flavobacteriales bacterium]|nr:GHKL domain-containing protein [Flavobacteriales bacterium]